MALTEGDMEMFKGYLFALKEMRPEIPRAERIEVISTSEKEHAIVLRWGNQGKCAAVVAVIKGSLGMASYVTSALNATELFMPKKIKTTAKKPETVKSEGPLTVEMEQP